MTWLSVNSTDPIAAYANESEMAISTPMTDTLDIRPLTAVYSDGPPQMINITTNQATLAFTSSIPLVCSVIFGIDETYGAIATDLDMNGEAHTNHQPLMVGLQSDTEYVYRVQGFDANGTLYVSEPMRFRTASESPSEETEVNVAALDAGAQVLAVSSNFGGAANDGAWGANSTIDGNTATAWSSNGDGNDAFIEVQLSEPSRPRAVEVWTRTMSNGTAQIFQFTLTTNPNTTASEILGPFTLPDATEAYRFDIEVASVVDSIRLDVVESNGGNTGLVEFGVYVTPTVTVTQSTDSELYLPLLIRPEDDTTQAIQK